MMTAVVRLVMPCIVAARVASAADAAGSSATNTLRVDYAIVVTGGELLHGVYQDAHTCFITRTLLPLGYHCVGSMCVDDNHADLEQALAFATRRASLVIVTGGLGPTVNDITRQTVSEFTGIPLREHEEIVAELERRFNQPKDRLRPNLRRQALAPASGTYFPNPAGTAAGLVFETPKSVIVALPGPPRELQPMVQNQLAAYLKRKFGARPVGASLTLRFAGLGQSQIDQTMRDSVAVPADAIVTSLFEGGRVDFTFTLPGNTPEDARQLQKLADGLRAHLGEHIYGEDGASLEEVVLTKLADRGGSLVLVELGTKGALASSLNAAKGAEKLLVGTCIAPSRERIRDLLRVPNATWSAWKSGEELARGVASAACHWVSSEMALVTGEIEEDEKGSRHIWIALALPGDQWITQRLEVRGAPETASATLVTQILDRLRRQLR